MRWLGYQRVKFSSVNMDVAEVRRRSKQAHVSDLAQTIRDHGDELINAPLVRMPGKVLIAGRDRMGALLSLKATHLWVRLCECTDEEAADLEAIENVHRRQDSRSDVLAKAVSVKEQLLRSRGGVTVSQAPQHSAKAEARRQVARAAGVTTAAVRQAEHRSAAKSSADGAAPPSSGAPAATAEEPAFSPNLDLLGVPFEDVAGTCGAAAYRQSTLDSINKHLIAAQSAATRLGDNAEAQQFHAEVHRFAAWARGMRPAAICPWCKAIAKLTADCPVCHTQGHVPAELMKAAESRVPRELRDPSAPTVFVNGTFYPYADALAGKLPKGRAA